MIRPIINSDHLVGDPRIALEVSPQRAPKHENAVIILTESLLTNVSTSFSSLRCCLILSFCTAIFVIKRGTYQSRPRFIHYPRSLSSTLSASSLVRSIWTSPKLTISWRLSQLYRSQVSRNRPLVLTNCTV